MTTPAAATDHADGTRTYTAPDPATGEMVELPNITGMFPEPKHIADWQLKMAMLGAALREDIAARVAAANLLEAGPKRNGALREVAELAMTAGQIIEKGHLPSDRGSALHALTERLDDLVPAGSVATVDELGLPLRLAQIAAAYVNAMTGVQIVRTEFTIANFAARYAGTSDRILRFEALDAWAAAFDTYDLGRGCFACDLKFGTVHDEVAMQLAAVTVAETIWDADTGTHSPLPADLRTDIGFVFQPDKGLMPVDLEGAADAFLGLVAWNRWTNNKPLRPALRRSSAPVGGNGAGGRSGCTTATGAGPTHIATPLAAVSATLTAGKADVFAGLPDHDGRPQPDRAAKREWLLGRLRALAGHPDGLAQVAARWPVVDGTPVPTFQDGHDHTAAQLAAIDAAITDAETELGAPWPDVDPTDPAFTIVANDDPRVAGLADRIAALPPDLQDQVAAGAQPAKVPNLRTGRVTLAHLAAVEPLVAGVESEARQRAGSINAALYVAGEKGVAANVVLGAVGVGDPKRLHGDRLTRFHAVVDAIALGVLIEKDRQLIVDQPAVVLDQYGGPGKVLAAARKLAKANGWPNPASSDAALADPVLTALLAVL